MAFYLVTARPRPERLEELRALVAGGSILAMRPFGRALAYSLAHARLREDGTAVWEEEDHCHPPLAQERAAVLDDYFGEFGVQPVVRGFGWARLRALPFLLPGLAWEAE
jgi:hypothetical protein